MEKLLNKYLVSSLDNNKYLFVTMSNKRVWILYQKMLDERFNIFSPTLKYLSSTSVFRVSHPPLSLARRARGKKERKEQRHCTLSKCTLARICARVREISGRFRSFTQRLMTGSCRYRNVRVPGEPEAGSTCARETRKKRGGGGRDIKETGSHGTVETFLTNRLNKSIT